MALLSGKALKEKESPEFLLDIGGGDQLLVRRPDLEMLVLESLAGTPLLASVITMFAEWVSRPVGQLTEDALEKRDDIVKLANAVVLHSVVSPHVIKDETHRLSENDVLLSDITLATKKKIVLSVVQNMHATQREVVAAAETFPEDGHGAGSGPDVQEVQPATV